MENPFRSLVPSDFQKGKQRGRVEGFWAAAVFQKGKQRGRVEGFWAAAVVAVVVSAACGYLFPELFLWLAER